MNLKNKKMQSKQKYVWVFNAFLAETNKILFLVWSFVYQQENIKVHQKRIFIIQLMKLLKNTFDLFSSSTRSNNNFSFRLWQKKGGSILDRRKLLT